MIKLKIEQRSEAWHEARLGLFTGTRFAKIMSSKTTTGYKDCITDVAGEIISSSKDETYSNAIMERGIELEPEAIKEYESIFNVEIEDVGICFTDDDNEFAEWVGVSPDGLIGDEGGLEIKCPLLKTHINYIKANKLPNEYKWQVQGALLVTGRKWWDFMSYYPNVKSFIVRVYPNKEMHDQLRTELREAIKLVKQEIEIYNKYDYLT